MSSPLSAIVDAVGRIREMPEWQQAAIAVGISLSVRELILLSRRLSRRRQGAINRSTADFVRIAVGSGSELKAAAVREAVKAELPDVRTHCVAAQSGVPEQPVGHEETIRGAENRLAHAKAWLLGPGADTMATGVTRSGTMATGVPVLLFAVGIENGLCEVRPGHWVDVAWVAMEDLHSGRRSLAHSAGVHVPEEYVREAFRAGPSPGAVTAGSVLAQMHRGFADAADPHSFLTAGTASRRALLTEAVSVAWGQLQRVEGLSAKLF